MYKKSISIAAGSHTIAYIQYNCPIYNVKEPYGVFICIVIIITAGIKKLMHAISIIGHVVVDANINYKMLSDLYPLSHNSHTKKADVH